MAYIKRIWEKFTNQVSSILYMSQLESNINDGNKIFYCSIHNWKKMQLHILMVNRIFFRTFAYYLAITTAKMINHFRWAFNPIQDGPFPGCSRIGGKKVPLPKICHTYPAKMKLGKVIPYLKKIQKMYESRNIFLEYCWQQHFLTRNQQISLFQERFLFMTSSPTKFYHVTQIILQMWSYDQSQVVRSKSPFSVYIW